MSGEQLVCALVSATRLECSDGTLWDEAEEALSPSSPTFWLFIVVCIVLVLLAGLMSGLTLGLLSFDTTSLTVIMNGGDEDERKHARAILPLVKQHHLLLVTLLLANAICMEALPLFLDRLTSPVAAVVISVTAVLFFGEVIPQAVCSRYGLAIGAKVKWLVWGIIGVFFVISYPISKLLDRVLGTDHGTYYRRQELSELVQMHATATAENEEPLSNDEVLVIRGALDMTHKHVTDAMTSIERVFMIDADAVLDQALFNEIRHHGHSRVPVYKGNIHKLVGLLIVKDLLGYDPRQPKLVGDLPLSAVVFVAPTVHLYDMLHTFESGKSHMAAIQREDGFNGRELLGVITLEDVIEELINKEIDDETDIARRTRKHRTSGAHFVIGGSNALRAVVSAAAGAAAPGAVSNGIAHGTPSAGLRVNTAGAAGGAAAGTPTPPHSQPTGAPHGLSVRIAGRQAPYSTVMARTSSAGAMGSSKSPARAHAAPAPFQGTYFESYPIADDDDDDDDNDAGAHLRNIDTAGRPLIRTPK